jgi:hypothetical protein
MKKIVYLVALLFILMSGLTKAQRASGIKYSSYSASTNKCFNEDSRILNIGIGFGGGRYYNYGSALGYTYRTSPAFSLTYEQSLKQKVGPGHLGVGAYFGYQRASFKYDDYFYAGTRYYYKHNWNYMLISARGAYHLDVLNTHNAELYFGAIVGLRLQTYNYETNSIDPNSSFYELSDRVIYPSYSLFVGGRWYFAPKVALFAEAGYGISYLTAGLSFKF